MVEQDQPYLHAAVTGNAAVKRVPEEEARIRRGMEEAWWFVRWPCLDGCQSEYRIWQVPAGSMVSCATCREPVCVDCQEEPVAYEFQRCWFCEDEATRPPALPKPVCAGQCITIAEAWDAAHPGQERDHNDSSYGLCAVCDEYICMECRSAQAGWMFGFCEPCASVPIDDLPPDFDGRDLAVAAALHHLAGRLVATGAGPYPHVNGWINRRMGVRHRRDACTAQLKVAVEAAQRWLDTLQRAAETGGVPSAHPKDRR
ncbi:hypothetical protein ACGGAQ_30235 [Micromonospora sp. NPDC047557]|uniref:hypothetical protein n=1 Tax=Micromonospora sp. NPDC047557 TaxID=3364250 RepID=UPI003711F664